MTPFGFNPLMTVLAGDPVSRTLQHYGCQRCYKMCNEYCVNRGAVNLGAVKLWDRIHHKIA